MTETVLPIPAPAPVVEEPLVLAMPRRELFRFSGFSAAIDMGLLESVGQESWYAVASTLAGNFDAKEVRLGLLIERGDQILIDAGGAILHTTRLGPEVSRLGSGLKALRELALLAGARLVGVERVRCELMGFLNEDAIVGYRDAMVLIYRCRVPEAAESPPGMSWVSHAALREMPIDPVSVMIAEALYPLVPPASP